LYCFHPFRVERGEAQCPSCGASQTRAEQETFWTLAPVWVRRQSMARGAGVLAIAGLAVFLAYQVRDDGSALFWGLGLLGLAAFFVWETAGLLTRRESALPLRILWPAILLCVALGPIAFSLLLRFIGGAGEAEVSWQVALAWAGPWLVPFGASFWLPRKFRKAREDCLEGGATH
ncbi:MAG: hypothetical protein KDB61_12715, partial [Planctomycetes bacterium]|nr:hypothetical protein [Planctomycetota bacterium]